MINNNIKREYFIYASKERSCMITMSVMMHEKVFGDLILFVELKEKI